MNLEDASQIDEQLFIGREDELAYLHEWLSPLTEQQNVVAISGLGGIGKTQLSLHFARQHHQRYSAVIWLTYVSLAQRIRRHNKQREAEQSEAIGERAGYSTSPTVAVSSGEQDVVVDVR